MNSVGAEQGIKPAGAGRWIVSAKHQHAQYRYTVTCSLTEARSLRARLVAALLEGKPIPTELVKRTGRKRKAVVVALPPDVPKVGTITVVEAVAAYLKTIRTKSSYKDMVRYGRQLDAEWGDRPLDSLLRSEIQAWMQRQATRTGQHGRQVAANTVNKCLQVLRSASRLALADGRVLRDVTLGVPKLTEPPGRRRALDDTEEVSLLEHLEHLHDLTTHECLVGEKHPPYPWAEQSKRLALVLALTGLRRANGVGLMWAWVKWERGLIEVPRTKNRRGQVLPMSSAVVALLRDQQAVTGDKPHVWRGERGEPLNAVWWWSKRLKPALAAAGVEDFRTHDLRHTFGTRLSADGVDMAVIQQLMGHSGIQVTQRYAHPDRSDPMRLAVERLGKREAPP